MVAISTSDKIDFKMNKVTRDKDAHVIMIERIIHLEDIKLISIYVPNLGAPIYIKPLLTDLMGKKRTKYNYSMGPEYLIDSNG